MADQVTWTKIARKNQQTVLLSREVSREWLRSARADVTRITLTGELHASLADLVAAARDKKIYLPTQALRPLLQFRLDNLVQLNKDLGLPRLEGAPLKPAVVLFTPPGGTQAIGTAFCAVLADWIAARLETWAQAHGFGVLAARLRTAVVPQNLRLESADEPYLREGNEPNYALVARTLGQRLVGQELFEGMGPCEIVAAADAEGNTVELMTQPRSGDSRQDSYSMVARLTVATMPFMPGVVLIVKAVKRTWASRLPTIHSALAPRRLQGYVQCTGMPAATVTIARTRDSEGTYRWQFDEDEYGSFQRVAMGSLPATLEEALLRREPPPKGGWWVGMPQLPALYRSLSQRSVYESDEYDLLGRITSLLQPLVVPTAPQHQVVPLPSLRNRSQQEMLTEGDLIAAGSALLSTGGASELDDESESPTEEARKRRKERFERFSAQCQAVVTKVCPSRQPLLLCLSDLLAERELIAKICEALFGQSVEFRANSLPANVHVLRGKLEPWKTPREERLNRRRDAWQALAESIRVETARRQVFVVVCASDFVGGKPEDPVNYLAAIHAMSRAGANVHYVLPIEPPGDESARKHFIYRAQNAIQDVVLAHSGAILGVKELATALLPATHVPKAIYGIQAVRSRSRQRGARDANFLLFTRTWVNSGLTEIRICHGKGSASAATCGRSTDGTGKSTDSDSGWKPLLQGLTWVGAQRTLQDSSALWLRNAFASTTVQLLDEIRLEDPGAPVMVDWGSVRGLWKGLSDSDLSRGGVRLDGRNLNGTGLVILRLRRGDDTTSVRTLSSQSFQGWRFQDGGKVATGETYQESYVTSTAVIVQMAVAQPESAAALRDDGNAGTMQDTGAQNQRQGQRQDAHFVASPSYNSTSQPKRGQSCYRPMKRMQALSKNGTGEEGEFTAQDLPVARADVGVPAPTDITVLNCPPDVSPAAYACLAMGMRLGYAHFKDWTALPAPLFFRRKVEDYIIRFPDDDDEAEQTRANPIPEPSAGVEGVADAVAGGNLAVDSLPVQYKGDSSELTSTTTSNADIGSIIAEIVEPPAPQPSAGQDESTPLTQVLEHADAPRQNEHEALRPGEAIDLLSRARDLKVPPVAEGGDLNNRRLYTRMINGDIRVHVDLPVWVPTKSLFVTQLEPSRRSIQRSWDLARDFMYVRTGRRGQQEMWSENRYLEDLAKMLRSPKGVSAVLTLTRGLGGISFAPLVGLLTQVYNPSVGEDERIENPLAVSAEKYGRVARWASQAGHDALGGWLVFLAAQVPVQEYAQEILGGLDRVLGPRTGNALEYYIESALALQDLIDATAARQTVINIHRTISQLPDAQLPVERLLGAQITPPSDLATASDSLDGTQEAGAATCDVDQISARMQPHAVATEAPLHQASFATEIRTVDSLLNTPPLTSHGAQLEDQQAAVGEILARINDLRPGAPSFEAALSQVQAHLDALASQHTQHLVREQEAAREHQRLQLVDGRRDELLERLLPLLEHLDLKGVQPRQLDAAVIDLDQLEDELQLLETRRAQAEEALNHAIGFDSQPAATSMLERTRRATRSAQLWVNASEACSQLRTMLDASRLVEAKAASLVASAHEPLSGSQPRDTSADSPNSPGAAIVALEGTTQQTPPATVKGARPPAHTPGSTPDPTLHAASDQASSATPVPPNTDGPPRFGDDAASQTVAAKVEEPAEPSPQPKKTSGGPLGPESSAVLHPELAPIPSPALPRVLNSAESGDDPDIPARAKQDRLAVEAMGADEHTAQKSDVVATLGPQTLSEQALVLHRLVDQRLYGIAGALTSAIESLDIPQARVHGTLMTSLVDELHAMECDSLFDRRPSASLVQMITNDLRSDDLCDPVHMAFGLLGAGFSALIFGETDLRWRLGQAISARAVNVSALHELMTHLDLIRQRHLTLERSAFLLSQVSDRRQVEAELERHRTRAAKWVNDAEIYAAFNHKGFFAMHQEMFGAKHPLGRCIAAIASKAPVSQVRSAMDEAKRCFAKPGSVVDDLFKSLRERTKPDGSYRVRAIENIAVTEKFVKGHLALAQGPAAEGGGSSILSRDLQQFMDRLGTLLNEAREQVGATASRNELEALYRLGAQKALQCGMGLFTPSQAATCVDLSGQRLLLQCPVGKDLLPALRSVDEFTPALCRAEDVFEECARLAREEIAGDLQSNAMADILADAQTAHLNAKRFRSAHSIERLVPVSGKGPTIALLHKQELIALEAELQEARQRVTHAMTLSALNEGESTRMLQFVEQLLMLCRSSEPIGTPTVGSSNYPDFPQARAALRGNVTQPLDSALASARQTLEMNLDQEEERLSPGGKHADIERVRAMVRSGNAAQLRTAHDALSLIRSGQALPRRAPQVIDLGSAYEELVESVKGAVRGTKPFLEALRERLLALPSAEDPSWLTALNEEQRDKGAQLIGAWLSFFSARNADPGERGEELFRQLGFAEQPILDRSNNKPNRVVFVFNSSPFRFATDPDDPTFIPPEIGSWASMLDCIVRYGETTENDIRHIGSEIKSTPTIVLARSRLSMPKRVRLTAHTKMMLVDDDLLAYMALHPDEQLQAMVRICVLTFDTNPYDDYQSKPVAPEMFFGRQEQIKQLREVKGITVLYGGRRLGKSSLLATIEKEYEASSGQAAAYITLEHADSSSDYMLAAWEQIYSHLATRGLIKTLRGAPAAWEGYFKHIRAEVIAAGFKSLYLLIDETDKFMSRELHRAKSEPSFVRSLTQLSDEARHSCNVRIVLAGLHNMTRLANDENSVFGKADQIALQPFGHQDMQRGLRLVTKPLAALGFVFAPKQEDLALHILSVCNFYPAFIQLYCKRLLEQLRNTRKDRGPNYITAQTLDAVENDTNLLSALREKFRYNLVLDRRYEAIALVLAFNYYEEVERGGKTGLTTGEVREYCETFFVALFQGAGAGAYEALLHEMVQLNVLKEVAGRYELRNPAIARIVGDRDRIQTAITSLADERPEVERNQGEKHPLMMRKSAVPIVFPMPAAWVRNQLRADHGRLTILVGNTQSGVAELSISSPERWDLLNWSFQSAPVHKAQHMHDLLLSLSRKRTEAATGPSILSVRNGGWSVAELQDYASAAQRAAKLYRRLMLIAHPERAWELAQEIELMDPEKAPDVVVADPWSLDAIYLRFQENPAVCAAPRALEAIKDATCGFGKNICALNTGMSLEEALALPEKASKAIDSLEAFYARIGLPGTVNADMRRRTEDFLQQLDGDRRDDLATLEEVRQDAGISRAMYLFCQWMGLLQTAHGNRWHVPPLLLKLIKSRPTP